MPYNYNKGKPIKLTASGKIVGLDKLHARQASVFPGDSERIDWLQTLILIEGLAPGPSARHYDLFLIVSLLARIFNLMFDIPIFQRPSASLFIGARAR